MAGIGDMVVKIVGDNSKFDRAIDSTQKKMTVLATKLKDIGKKMTLFVSLPILGIGLASVKAAADMEMMEVAFATMLGSAEKAHSLLTDLKELAAHTPFQLTDLTAGTKTLLQFGVALEDVMPTLTTLGDIAMGDSNRMKSLSLAFGQMTSAGRLMGQDLLQMINVGFNPLQVIAKKTGETMMELKDRMSKGAISSEEVAAAFKSATSEGGMFYQGMEKASQTLTGKFSTLKDNIVEMARNFGEVLLPAMMKIVAGLTSLVQKFTGMSEGTKKTIIILGLLAAATGPVMMGIGGIIKLVPKLVAGFQKLWLAAASLNIALGPALLLAAFAALVATMIVLQIKQDRLNEQWREFTELTERQYEAVNKLVPRFEELANQEVLTADEAEELARLTRELKDTYPELTTEVDTNTGALRLNQIALRSVTEQVLINMMKIKEAGVEQAELDARIAQGKLQMVRATPNAPGLTAAQNAERLAVALREVDTANAKVWSSIGAVKQASTDLSNYRIETNRLEAQALIDLRDKKTESAGVEKKDAEDVVKVKIDAENNVNDVTKLKTAERLLFIKTAEEEATEWRRKHRAIDYKKQAQERNAAEGRAERISIDLFRDALDARERIKKAKEDQAKAEADIAVAETKQNWKTLGDVFKNTVFGIIDIIGGDFKDAALNTISEILAAQQEALAIEMEDKREAFELENEMRQERLEADLEAIETKKSAQLEAIDIALQEALYAAGFSEATTVEQYEAEIAAAQAAGDAETAAELQKQLDKLVIIKSFEAQSEAVAAAAEAAKTARNEREKVEAQTAVDSQVAEEKRLTDEKDKIEKRAAYDSAVINKESALFNIAVSTAQAIVNALGSIPFPFNIAASALMGVLGAAQAISVSSKPLPALARGGIVSPTSGGTDVTVAEAGQAEVIFPLDKLDQFLSQREPSSEEGMMSLIVNLDSDPFLQKIFPATRNKTVLIDQGAVI